MDPETAKTIKIIITGFLAYIWDKFTRTSATITIKNKHQNLTLIEPTIFPLGLIKNPPDTVINPRESSDPIKLTAGSGHRISKGMLSYRIISQGGSNSLYLVITWKVKVSGKNSMSISVNDYESPPLKSLNNFDDTFNGLHRSNKTYPNEIAKWPPNNDSDFIVTGNIDTNSKAKIKVTFSQNLQKTEVTPGSSNFQETEVTAGSSKVPQLNNIEIEDASLKKKKKNKSKR